MYGTVARFRVKPGMESKLQDLNREYESLRIPGYVGTHVYRMDQDSNEYYLVVLFDSKASYVANANSPEQDARYRRFRDMLLSDPEWHDGEVVHSFVGSGTSASR